jgi:hypothetical protein
MNSIQTHDDVPRDSGYAYPYWSKKGATGFTHWYLHKSEDWDEATTNRSNKMANVTNSHAKAQRKKLGLCAFASLRETLFDVPWDWSLW